jgi:pyruvate dehydrogenase E1 component beta subunit
MISRKISYSQAINEALAQSMELSKDVLLLGQLIDRKPGVFGSTLGLAEKFGRDRVRDFLVAESLMTSVGIGLALAGKRPVLIHHRLDFALYSMDAIANWLSLWRFKSNGSSGLPVTIRAIIGKGWGQGPQHSKSLQSWFVHLPGLRVAMPSTPYDAKGLLLESILGNDPAVILEPRSLYSMTNPVPEAPYRVRFGHAAVRRKGQDLTLVAIGNLVPSALRAADILAKEDISVEVVDPRSLSPLDEDTICSSVARTRRLLVADPAWRTAGVSAEIIAMVCEHCNERLVAPPGRVTFPDSHTPMSSACEPHFSPEANSIVRAARLMFAKK